MHWNDSNGYGTADAIYLWERGNETFSYETYCLPTYEEISEDWRTRCQTENYCENNPVDEICSVSRSAFWVGEVALMYPSDYALVYANGVDAACYSNPYNCFVDSIGTAVDNGTPSNGWIYNSNNLEGQNSISSLWLVSPGSDDLDNAFFIGSDGAVYLSRYGYDEYCVRPVLYLSSNVKITDGTGEQNNPYKLGL